MTNNFDSLKNILGFVPQTEVSQNLDPVSETANEVDNVLSKLEKIEANKDKLDLRPNLKFVVRNLEIFENALFRIFKRKVSKDSLKWSQNLNFFGVEDIVLPQVEPEECRSILARMPEVLIKLSNLENIDYHTFGNKKVIPVPGFDEMGNFDPSKVQLAPVDEFPRDGDHPSRILVGVSNGFDIFPTTIPPSVSESNRAIYLYQVHVLLHEFFHSVELLIRDVEQRSEILLEVDDQKFTFQDWWSAFEELILSGIEPLGVSYYANTYSDVLNNEIKKTDEKKFTHALAEQICESFVAYQLGIISNKQGWTDFRSESFGNVEQLSKFIKCEALSANLKWQLMDKLCRAKIVE